MKRSVFFVVALFLLSAAAATAQKDADNEPTATLNFLVIKDDNGKPVRNASVIMHSVSSGGKQERGGLELKTDLDGKSSSDGMPYGSRRAPGLATGSQSSGAVL